MAIRQRIHGGSDGARTRDLRRDRPTIYLTISNAVPTFSVVERAAFRAEVGTLPNGPRTPQGSVVYPKGGREPIPTLFRDQYGSLLQPFRDRDIKFFRSLEIDYELLFGRFRNGDIADLLSAHH